MVRDAWQYWNNLTLAQRAGSVVVASYCPGAEPHEIGSAPPTAKRRHHTARDANPGEWCRPQGIDPPPAATRRLHIYSADICLQAHELGLAVVALNAACHHNTRTTVLPRTFFKSAVSSPKNGATACPWPRHASSSTSENASGYLAALPNRRDGAAEGELQPHPL